MEEMKQIILEGEPTPFYITRTGQLFRKDTGNWYKPFLNCGYLSYHLKWNNKTYPKKIHRLVAEAFIPNPDNKPYVHHIDHNRFNNNVDNLQWVTAKENNLSKLPRLNQMKVVNDKINFDKEEWKQYKDSQFYVSNMGRVKNILSKNILKGNVRDNGYLRVGLRFGNKIIFYNVHNLVWEVWEGKQKGVINHKNGNKLDNRLENLEDISQSENILKACYEMRTRNAMAVGAYDEQNNLIAVYPSQRKAEIALNLSRGSISRAIKEVLKRAGYYWKKISEEDYREKFNDQP